MGYEIKRITLATTRTIVLEGRIGRKTVAFHNTDSSITIHVTQGSALTGFPIAPASPIGFNHRDDGDMVEDVFQIVAESGTPTVAVIETW